MEHIEEQSEQVTKHLAKMADMIHNRRLFGLNDDDEDDLEDDRGARYDKNHDKLTAALHTFEGVQGWLTNDGVESLEVCSPYRYS